MQRLLSDPCALAALVQAAGSTHETSEPARDAGTADACARGPPGASPAEPPAPEAARAGAPASGAAAAPGSACRQQSACRAELDAGEEAAEWGAQTGAPARTGPPARCRAGGGRLRRDAGVVPPAGTHARVCDFRHETDLLKMQ